MGTIISSRMKEDGKIILELSIDYAEFLQLKGHMENTHVFCENVADLETFIAGRGKNEATKYFLIPKALRKDLKLNSQVKCQMVDTKTKTFFVYVMDKLK